MYETHEKNIEWGKIIKKGSIIIGILIAALICFTLISKAFKKPTDKPTTEDNQPITLSAQLDEVETALLKFLDEDSIPKEINSSKTVRVKLLKDKGLIQELKDSENNSCESNNSFAEITRFEENYAVSISLTCGPHKENRLIYIGCFSECNGEICKGTAESTNGVCYENKTPETTQPENNESSTPNNNTSNTTTPKPSNKPSTTTKPNNNKKEKMYEFQKCTTTYSCSKGTLNQSTNKCVYNAGTTTLYDGYTTREIKSVSSTLTVYNTKDIYYLLLSFKDGHYNYRIYQCNDKTYTYNPSTDKCFKTVDKTEEIPAQAQTSCNYTWSYSPTLDGWTRTGKTK